MRPAISRTTSGLRRAFMVSTSGVTMLILGLVVASSTGAGAGSLRGLENLLGRTLHVAGLVTDAHAGGGGGPASAASGVGSTEPATVQIGPRAELVARVIVALPVTVTCAPLPGGAVTFGGVFAQVYQAQGRTVLSGSGFANVAANSCDNSPHTYIVDVYPNSNASGVGVFHFGPAAATANAYACDSSYDCASGSAPAQSIQIGS